MRSRAIKAAQTDTQARWTVKTVWRREPAGTQRRLPEIAIPVFGYKSHIAIDRAYGFIRRSAVTDAACHDGRISHIHRKKPPGRVMPKAAARANARKSAVRAYIEHVFAHQKDRMDLVIRTIGLKRAEAKIGLANLAYNFQRLIFHKRRATVA